MDVKFFQENIKFRFSQKTRIKNWLKDLAQKYKIEILFINIIFTTSKNLKSVNVQFLKHNYNTDVITFSYCIDDVIQAEIYIDYKTVKSNAKRYKTTFNLEMARVIVHGFFHILNYEDHTDEQKKEMRELEDNALNLLQNKYGFKI